MPEGSACSASKGHGCCKNADVELPDVKMCVDSVCKAAEEGFSTCLINKALTAGADCKCGGPLEIEALPKRRLAERFESLLAKADAWVEEKGTRPMVFFANMGPLRQHKARADFSRDFLRAGGLDVVYPSGFPTPEEAARAAADSGCAVSHAKQRRATQARSSRLMIRMADIKTYPFVFIRSYVFYLKMLQNKKRLLSDLQDLKRSV